MTDDVRTAQVIAGHDRRRSDFSESGLWQLALPLAALRQFGDKDSSGFDFLSYLLTAPENMTKCNQKARCQI
jgi:hypothetical protein